MMTAFAEFEELRELLDALCEETIEPQQVQRLEQLILSRPEAEAYYVQYISLFADLSQDLSAAPRLVEQALCGRLGTTPREESTQPGASTPAAARSRSRTTLWGSLAFCAAAAGLLMVVPMLWNGRSSPPVVSGGPDAAQKQKDQASNRPRPTGGKPEPTDNTVAVLLHAPGAEWEAGDLPTRPGSPLPPGRMRLKAGFAHIEFYSGATVVLEGPADFELISPMEAFCARGKLRASVPTHAQGFTIGSPRLDLIDLGTEFGLNVEGGEATEVHVFEGRVELQDSATHDPLLEPELTTGQAVRLEGRDASRSIETDPAAFLSAEDLAARSQAAARRRLRDWLAAGDALRRDAGLLLRYTFQTDDTWSRTLSNQAAGGQPAQDGTIVGCTWTTGRWPGKQALQFKQVSDRVRLHVPGEFRDLTMATWVRVEGLPNQFNSLLMTDSWDEGEVHWHIARDGTIELGVQGPDRKSGAHYYARGSFGPEQFGKWVHLAVVHDAGDGKVRHYRDGVQVHEEFIILDGPLRIGDAELGNWNVTTRRHNHPIRFFDGRMDEFMLFSRALAPDEVADLYAQGRPQ